MTLMNIFAHIDNISYKSIRSKLRGILPGEIQEIQVNPHFLNASPTGSAAFLGKHPIDGVICQNGLNRAFTKSCNLASLWRKKIVCRKRRLLSACLTGYDEDNAKGARASAVNLLLG